MRYKITPPKKIKATIKLPSSKSICNRLLILNALSCIETPIENLSDCEDTQVILEAFNNESNVFDIKGAGTAMRFLTAFLASMEGEWIIKGDARMHERPIYPLVNTLITLGAQIDYLEKEGYPPLKINGKHLKGGSVYIAGNMSSQFISALLMIAPKMDNGLTIHLENEIISKPYIKLTLGLMEAYGVKAKWDGKEIRVENQDYTPKPIKVEADWSAASYWYSFASLLEEAEITLLGLSQNSLQGDANLKDLFLDLGVNTEFIEDGIIIRKTHKSTKKFFCDFVKEPDLAQTFVVTCCLLGIPFLFSGIQTLKIKETDRIEALKTELKKLGFILNENDNHILEWNGKRCTPHPNAVIETYNDHRMAMSFTPACIPFKSITIDNPKVVTKSYPNFWNDLETTGFTIDKIEN